MSRAEDESFPWLHLYAEALAAGLDAGTFWASSPRAVHLVIRERRKRTSSVPHPTRSTIPRGDGRRRPAKVRLNRLPHP